MGPEDYDRINRRIRYGATRPGVFINRRHQKGSSVLFGVLLTLLGVALLLDNLGFLEFRDIWRFWPVIRQRLGLPFFESSCRRIAGTRHTPIHSRR